MKLRNKVIMNFVIISFNCTSKDCAKKLKRETVMVTECYKYEIRIYTSSQELDLADDKKAWLYPSRGNWQSFFV